MTLDRATALFFDASALFSASHSPLSGSSFLVLACTNGYLRAVVSPDVLIEAERNLLGKSTMQAFTRYRDIVAVTPLRMVSAPDRATVLHYEPAFFEDAHVVAAALASSAQYLVTLDQRLASRVRQVDLPIIAISPRDFIQTVLPGHPEYLEIRALNQ